MYPFQYSLSENELLIKIGGFLVRSVAYSDMDSASLSYSIVSEHWTNFFSLRFITIQRKTGPIKSLVINPLNANEFIIELQAKIAQAAAAEAVLSSEKTDTQTATKTTEEVVVHAKTEVTNRKSESAKGIKRPARERTVESTQLSEAESL